MGRQPVSVGGRADVAKFRNELLGRLGLGTTASDQDIEEAHTELVEYLEAAPREAHSWAAARTVDLDEAFALLSGPEQDLIPPAPIVATPQDGLDDTLRTTQAAPGALAAPSTPTAPSTPAAPAAPTAPAGTSRRTQLLRVILPLLAVAVVLFVWNMGRASDVPGISGTPTNNPSASATSASGAPAAVPVDQTKVATLTKKVTANPKDLASLQGIADLYFAAAEYKTASLWEKKILAVDPKNQVALLALGAAQFNAGNPAEAKKQWLVAAKLYPKNAEVHYDLGFLYMSQTPPDKAKMTAEWQQVVAIDPNSALAKTVATHLKSTATPTPAASAKPSSK